MSQDIEDLGWGFLRDMQWPAGAQDQVEFEPVKSSKSAHKKSMGVAVAVALSLTVGAVGLYLWKRDRTEPEAVAEWEEVEEVEYEYPPRAPAPAPIEVFAPMRTPPASQPAVGRRPLTEGVPLPFAHEEFEKLMKTARTMVAFSRDPQGQLVLTWAWTWKGTPYPMSDHPDDHPSILQAKKIVATAVELARAERAAQAEHEEELDEDEEFEEDEEVEEQLAVESVEELTCELPRPGYFFCVREGDELLGDAGLATGALLVEAMSMGFDAGWDRQTIEAHASELAADTGARAAYAELIRESEWNAGQVEELAEGTLLWLPPLEPLRLGEGNRRPRIDVDARPWPDGSSRLEPPPQLRLS